MEEKTPIQKVVDIFNNYYGEDRVDLQDDKILVHFPRVTVSNENDRSVDITELYVKVQLNNSGLLIGTFTLNRTEYTIEQWYSSYLHSHVHSLNKSNLSEFKTPCLGSGPIKDTCLTLNSSFDEDIWNLFVFELDKYVQTESVSGIPYMYLEKIGMTPGGYTERTIEISESIQSLPYTMIQPVNDILIQKFLPYLINSRLFSFNYNGKYGIADSPYNIVVRMSNLFIEWYNNLPAEEQGTIQEDLMSSECLIVCKASSGIITRKSVINHDYNQYRRVQGSPLWRFKGETLHLSITGIPENDNNPIEGVDENQSILLHPVVVMYIVNRILKVINYRYGRFEGVGPDKKATYI